MEKKMILLFLIIAVLLMGCEQPEIHLSTDDFEIVGVNWDPEIEFDCEKCDKPICNWDIAWELEYNFNPSNGKEEAICLYSIDGKVKVRSISQKNKMLVGMHKLSDPSFLLDCWQDHLVGLCCAYSTNELLKETYACKDVPLEALCVREE